MAVNLSNMAPPPEADLRKPQQQAELNVQQQLSKIAQAPATATQKAEAASEAALASQQQVAGAQAQELQAAAQEGLQQRALQADAAKLQKVKELRARKLQVAQEQRKAELGLAALDATANERLYQSNIKFERDNLGRIALNEVQLADWALMNAQNEEELMNFESTLADVFERKRTLLEAAANKIMQAMQQEFERADQIERQRLTSEMAEFKRLSEEAVAEAKAKAANTAAIWTAGSTIIGGIASIWNPVLGAGIMAIGGLAGANEAKAAGTANKPKPSWEK